jgi:hypothetical protein
MRAAVLAAIAIGAAAPARADLLNHDLLRHHAEAVLARTPPERRGDLVAHRLPLVAATLIPVVGTWRVENRVFGGLRPSGVIFDWVLGGLAPLGFGVAALATDGTTRETCAYTALGLYVATRLGILVIANLHISAWNRAVVRVRDSRRSP